MKLLIFIPAYGRHETTDICYRALGNRISTAPPALSISVLCIVSNTEDEALACSFGFKTVRVANKPLGRKFNAGLKHALDGDAFDYLLQMNSDNVLSINFWDTFSSFLTGGYPFFGVHQLAFYDFINGGWVRYQYPTGCGIRFLKRGIIAEAPHQVLIDNKIPRATARYQIPAGKVWRPRRKYREAIDGPIIERRFQLWTPTINRGLDFDSDNTIRRAFPEPEYRQRFPYQDQPTPLVCDIKTEDNIHPFSEFAGDDMAQGVVPGSHQEAEMERLFPEVKLRQRRQNLGLRHRPKKGA